MHLLHAVTGFMVFCKREGENGTGGEAEGVQNPWPPPQCATIVLLYLDNIISSILLEVLLSLSTTTEFT